MGLHYIDRVKTKKIYDLKNEIAQLKIHLSLQ